MIRPRKTYVPCEPQPIQSIQLVEYGISLKVDSGNKRRIYPSWTSCLWRISSAELTRGTMQIPLKCYQIANEGRTNSIMTSNDQQRGCCSRACGDEIVSVRLYCGSTTPAMINLCWVWWQRHNVIDMEHNYELPCLAFEACIVLQ